MPRFSANLWYLFQELDLMDRFRAAAEAGFPAVEMQFPYDWPKQRFQDLLGEHGLELVLINTPAGDRENGERGLAGLAGREGEFRDAVGLAVDYARALDCPAVHVMAGIPEAGTDREDALETLSANLGFAAERCGEAGIRATIEAINRDDVPGYLIGTTGEALDAIARAGHANVYLQYDLYHGAVTGDDLARTLEDNIGRIAHIQVAAREGRHEPAGPAFGKLFKAIDAMGYDGWIGCEYRPRAETVEGLGWAAPYGIGKGGTGQGND